MAQSISSVFVHFVFSTKQRDELILPELSSHLHKYIGGICRNHKSLLLAIGGMPDHVHLLVRLGREASQSSLMMHVKKDSSRFMKEGCRRFAWQDGFAAFSIGESQRERTIRYIENQERHHKKRSFQEEVREFLEKYKSEYDPEWLWD